MHAKRDDLFVVRAVEDADPSPLRKTLRDAPEEVVVELLRGRRLERDHLNALRVDARHHVLDRAVLPGDVHCLQDNEQCVRVARPEQLLGLGEVFDSSGQHLPCFGLELLV